MQRCGAYFHSNYKGLSVSVLALMVSLPASGMAETVTYPGTALTNGVSINGANRNNVLKPAASYANNTVTRNAGGTTPNYVLGGHATISAAVTNNKVYIYNTINNNVYGGYIDIGTATISSGHGVNGNEVRVDGAVVNGSVYGAYASADNSVAGIGNRLNKVFINNSAIAGPIYGGYSLAIGAALVTNNNSVFISGISTVGSAVTSANVYGGYIDSTTNWVSDNTVTIQDTTTIWGDIYGGYQRQSGGLTAAGNQVNVTGGTVNGAIYGGSAASTNAVSNNVVTVTETVDPVVVTGDIYGGHNRTNTGAASSNMVTINGGTVGTNAANRVYGGYSQSGGATSNGVTVTGGNLRGSVYGGYSGSNRASNNNATLTSGRIDGVFCGGFSGSNTATSNTTTINGGSVGGMICGGGATTGTATANTLTIAGGTAEGAVYGSYGYNATAGNTVSISGGTFRDIVSAGYSANAGSTGNRIEISDGNFAGDVYAGSSGRTIGAGFTNNAMTISGTGINAPGISLWGIYDPTGSKTYFDRGNSLLIAAPVRIAGAYNFFSYDFLVSGAVSNGDTLLSVTDPFNLDLVTAGDVILTLSADETKGALPDGGFTIIDNTVGDYVNRTTTVRGSLVDYDFTVGKDGNALKVLTYGGAHVRDIINVFGSPHSAVLSHINFVSDFLTDVIDHEARSASGTCVQSDDGKCLTGVNSGDVIVPGGSFFGAGSGAGISHNAGIPTDVRGIGMVAGYAYGFNVGAGLGMVAGFAETGFSSFQSEIYDEGMGHKVHGSGTSRQYGLGVLGRYEYGGFHTEASARVGKSWTAFSTDLAPTASGQTASYTVSPLYYVTHIGVGYQVPLLRGMALDFNSRYFWTHQNGSEAEVMGYNLKFDSANSHRWYNEALVNVSLDRGVKVYAGGGYEWEFDNSVGVTVSDVDVVQAMAPSLRGGTGVVKMGATLGDTKDAGMLDLGVQGYLGKRQGIGGTLKFRYNF